MSRPFARLKLGYYPLPTEEARNIVMAWSLRVESEQHKSRAGGQDVYCELVVEKKI